jgi:hypothetical protein
MQYGVDTSHLFDVNWRTTETMDTPPSIYTGDWRVVLDAGFDGVQPHIDKVQRSSLLKLIPLWPFIKLFGWMAMRRERHRFHTLDEANEPLVRAMNSTPLLLGRTISARAVKP